MNSVPRTPDDARRWMAEGTEALLAGLERRDDEAVAGPTSLPGWSGPHLLAHLAANAEALRNLARWARTGVRTPMYASAGQRDADIEAGAARELGELRDWVRASASLLAQDLAELTSAQWQAEVVTAQGRAVPATEIPWLRAREVMVHAVDLGLRGFGELPPDFLAALLSDVVDKRSAQPGPALLIAPDDSPARWRLAGDPPPAEVTGRLADLVAYLTGRPGAPVTTLDGTSVPTLSRWL